MENHSFVGHHHRIILPSESVLPSALKWVDRNKEVEMRVTQMSMNCGEPYWRRGPRRYNLAVGFDVGLAVSRAQHGGVYTDIGPETCRASY